MVILIVEDDSRHAEKLKEMLNACVTESEETLFKDPDIRMYGDNNDKKSARYILAVDRGVKHDPNNPEQQTADFINCICYGRAADFDSACESSILSPAAN